MATVTHDCGKSAAGEGAGIGTGSGSGGGNTVVTSAGGSCTKTWMPQYQTPSDTAAYVFTARTATAGYIQMAGSGFSATVGVASGCWYMIDSAFSASVQVIIAGSGNGQNYVGMNAGSRLYLNTAAGTIYTSTVALTFGRWYWISHGVLPNSTTGISQFGVWDVRGSLVDTYTSAANQNTSGVTGATVQFGKISASGNSGVYRLASFRGTTDGYALIPPPIPKGVRDWGLAA